MQKILMLLLMVILVSVGCDLVEQAEKAIVDISGKVSDEGQAVEGAIVLLVESANITDGLNLSNGSITDNRGNYIILNVDPGSYYVLAVKDQNNNLKFDADTDQLGFYGVNPGASDLIPDKIKVTEEDLEDINITDLYSLPQ
jgi:uncharacterized protein (DUF2141 family)